jgi:hypothetical protein
MGFMDGLPMLVHLQAQVELTAQHFVAILYESRLHPHLFLDFADIILL